MSIRISTQLDPTQVARRLSVSRMLTVASPDYLARHGRPAVPADLLAHQCLGYTGTARASWPYFIGGEVVWVPVRCRLQANSGDALVDAAQRGLGICCQPSFIAAAALRAGLLEEVLADFPTPELGIYALFPSPRYVPSRVRALADYLALRIGPVAYWDQGIA
jgi:DNA-binding transcriptional LysR family regulator